MVAEGIDKHRRNYSYGAHSSASSARRKAAGRAASADQVVASEAGEDRRRHGAERHGDDERQDVVFVVAERGYREGHIRQLMRTVPFTILGDVPLQVVEAEAGFIETAACCPGQWTPWCGAALRDADADAQGELSL
jgi:hypothetical protein